MPLHRASDQKSKTLTEFYDEVAGRSDASVADGGRTMLQLIMQLDAKLAGTPVWGLTSHYELKLLAADDYRSPWFVSIALPVGNAFEIDYLMPLTEAPWPNARVVGEVNGLESAVQMVCLAMEKCGAWRLA